MPRYYFDRRDGGFDPDTEGTELPGLEAARIEAINYAAAAVKDRPDYVGEGNDFRVEMFDERKLLLYTVVVIGIDEPTGGGALAA